MGLLVELSNVAVASAPIFCKISSRLRFLEAAVIVDLLSKRVES
jgi:hypothetical protein